MYDLPIDTTYITESQTEDNFKNFSQYYNLRSGLIFSQKSNDLYFLSGLIGSFTYSDGKKRSINFAGDQFLIGNIKFKEYYYQVEVPIYLNYSPVNWFEVFGGYHLAYIFQDYVYSNKVDEYFAGRGDKNEKETFGNYEKTYLGINLKHKSGFQAQIGFNGTLTSYNNWSFSLGYLF